LAPGKSKRRFVMHVFLNLMLIRSFPPPPSLFHHLERMMREREREEGREREGERERERN
jgi:hypothetical protein